HGELSSRANESGSGLDSRVKYLLLSVMLVGGLLVGRSGWSMGIPQILYQTNEDFIAEAFNGVEPQWKMLRLDAALKKTAERILHHPYEGMRIRYWIAGERTAWIIDEIGKEMPITIGLVVEGNAIDQ